MTLLLRLVFLGLTAVLAGLVPTLLFFQTAADRRVVIVGGVATAGSYAAVLAGAPPLVVLTVAGLRIFPVWAIVLGFAVAAGWRLLGAATPAPPTDEERLAELQRRARERARKLGRR